MLLQTLVSKPGKAVTAGDFLRVYFDSPPPKPPAPAEREGGGQGVIFCKYP